MIGQRSRGGKSAAGGQLGTGKGTLRLRAKGTATVEEEVGFVLVFCIHLGAALKAPSKSRFLYQTHDHFRLEGQGAADTWGTPPPASSPPSHSPSRLGNISAVPSLSLGQNPGIPSLPANPQQVDCSDSRRQLTPTFSRGN